jgi:hypothetical protein
MIEACAVNPGVLEARDPKGSTGVRAPDRSPGTKKQADDAETVRGFRRRKTP